MRIFDTHLHADTRSYEDLTSLALGGTEAAVTCAHDALPFRGPAGVFDHFERLLTREHSRLKANGIAPVIALGVHPQGLPVEGLAETLEGLGRYLDRPGVGAVGEIGLEKGGDREGEALVIQLRLAKDRGLPVILHTPNREKKALTKELLGALHQVDFPPERAVIDHADGATVPLILGFGAVAGITVHPAHLEPKEAAHICREYRGQRLFPSSDLGGAPSDLWSLPKTGLVLRRLGWSHEEILAVFWEGPRAFYGLG